jgi:hopanoid biosynthesis associated RND transporter like protein HpnN
MTRLDNFLSRASASAVRFAERHAAAVVGVSLLLTVVSAAATVNWLGLNTDTRAMLSEDLPFRRLTKQFETAFPVLEQPMIIVVDAESASRAREAAAALAERLRADDTHFETVFAPGIGSFFETYGLLYLDTEALEDFADRLVVALPFFMRLAREPTLDSMVGVLDDALDERAPVSDTSLTEAFTGIADVLEAALDADDTSAAWEEWAAGSDDDGKRRIIIVQPVLEFGHLKAAQRPMDAVRKAAEELELTLDNGIGVRITGDAALNTEEMDAVARQAGLLAVGASFLVVTLLLMLGLRSSRLVSVTVTTLAVGLLWTTGFAAATIGDLSLISIPFAVLFVGLAVDFGIHFSLRFYELRAAGIEGDAALVETGRSVGSSITLCAITTAIGFFAFVPTHYAGVAQLGFISGSGMFFSLAATLLFYPALLHLTGGTRAQLTKHRTAFGAPVSELPLRRPLIVVVTGIMIAITCIATLPYIRFDPDPVKVRDPNSESVQTMNDLLADNPEAPWTVQVLATDLDAAVALAARIEELDTVERAVTLQDFVPIAQEEKLEIIEDLNFFLAPVGSSGDDVDTVPNVDKILPELGNVSKRLREMARAPGRTPQLDQALERLATALDQLRARVETAADPVAEAARMQTALLGNLPGWLDGLETALGAEQFGLDDLPNSLRSRYIAADGRARIEVFPATDLSDDAALNRFVDSVREIVPNTTGAAVEIVESGRAIVGALQQALATATAAVVLLLLVLWRDVRDMLLVVSTLALASLMTAATTVALDIPFNFADVIVVPLLLGIGVDSGIHLVHRHRMDGLAHAVLSTSTARGVIFSALTTIASFGSLAFSTHRGMASLGALLTLGLTYMLVANLCFLPALILWTDQRIPRTRAVTPRPTA